MKRAIAIALASACLAGAGGVSAQTNSAASQSSTPTTGDVSAGTYGSGTTVAHSVGVSGGRSAPAPVAGRAPRMGRSGPVPCRSTRSAAKSP